MVKDDQFWQLPQVLKEVIETQKDVDQKLLFEWMDFDENEWKLVREGKVLEKLAKRELPEELEEKLNTNTWAWFRMDIENKINEK